METLVIIGAIIVAGVWLFDRYRQAQVAQRQDEIRRQDEAASLERSRLETVRNQLSRRCIRASGLCSTGILLWQRTAFKRFVARIRMRGESQIGLT